MKCQYKFWSNEQKEQLVHFAKTHHLSNQKVKWTVYKDQVEGKSRQQCKSYYTNVLKHLLVDEIPKYDINIIIDLIYQFLVTNGDIVKFRSHFKQLTDKQFIQYMTQLQEVQIILLAQIPFILKYPDTNYQFNYEILELNVLIHQRYPQIIQKIYSKANDQILVNENEAYLVYEKVKEILNDRTFVMNIK
ncbi:SANT/Myb_domain [Hexamita inflata]|uniref:SANT/Myb domain n=1 Tax=Hexamita inflata TaxID=28002 RepID=A0AA86N457_9EUKA|nr:SANT/Myb domain [Hexamita inflata]